MRPRIKPGEFVVIEPNHVIVPGDEVMVKTRDGRSMVKVLGFRRGGTLELLSINEDHRPITLDENEVDRVHYVAGIIKASLYYKET
jgi:phage repressor protein C with HTH and peptisase S24 domain